MATPACEEPGKNDHLCCGHNTGVSSIGCVSACVFVCVRAHAKTQSAVSSSLMRTRCFVISLAFTFSLSELNDFFESLMYVLWC